MENEETKICENCKREIPAINFTIHAVHCARNIRVCPACKEPVPQSELQEHHEKLHKLLPCKECGESVCGTDLEDHIRDSCAHTMKTCKFCALELRRASLPPHERYCGARTELCAACGEWVMHKYRQLHLDSNHGFVRLHDDPAPTENNITATNVPKSDSAKDSKLSSVESDSVGVPKLTSNTNRLQSEARRFPPTDPSLLNSIPETSRPRRAVPTPSASEQLSERCAGGGGAGPGVPGDLANSLRASRGAVKKRPAPKPPGRPPAPDPRTERLHSAPRRQRQEAERPAALPAAAGQAAGQAAQLDELRGPSVRRSAGGEPRPRPTREALAHKGDLENLKPMSAEEFMDRFNEMQLQKEPGEERLRNGDRFSQIKSSLRELRRGLNEVTAPYNSGAGSDPPHAVLPCEFCGAGVRADRLVLHQTGCRPDLAQLRVRREPSPDDAPPVIPCEFCTAALPLYLISEHQERCGREANLLFPD